MDFHHLSPADLPGAPQLSTWPMVSPMNASRRPSRDAAHHSGSGRMASPFPWGTFTSYSLPASWRTQSRVTGPVNAARFMTAPSTSQRRARSAALNAPCAVQLSRIGTLLGFLDIDSLPAQLGARPDKFCDGHLLQGSRLKRR